MYIQIHTLRTFPPHIPNRGGDGLAKRGIFGDVERQRISYQCHQYALKTSPLIDAMNERFGGTLRSRLIGDRFIRPQLEAAGMTEFESSAWANEILSLWKKENNDEEADAKPAGKKRGRGKSAAAQEDGVESEEAVAAAEGSETDQPLVLGVKEADALAVIALTLHKHGIASSDLRKLIKAANKSLQINKVLSADQKAQPDVAAEILNALEVFDAIQANAGFDGALFGRMATGVAVSNVRRALRMSDWLTTHEITTISDFFSTTDSLKDSDSEESGASHINNREMGVGVFYQHACISVNQLKANLGVEDVSDVVDWLLTSLVEIDPVSGRANSCLMDMAVQVGKKQPRSLASAFLSPVPPTQATQALRAFAETQANLDGLGAPQLWLSDLGIDALREQLQQLLVAA